jgi:cytochrome c6
VPLALNGYEIGVLTVALVFIAFALVASLVVPRSRPNFPSKWLGVFVAVCIVLFLAQMGAVLAMAELGEEEHAEAMEQPENGETEPEPTQPEPEPTEPAPGGSTAAGKEIFVANCASCHTLADAGTTGTVGPNLDEAQPPRELVVERVTNGLGVMPSFEGTLTEEQIAEVAAYVSSAAGS